eukprot:TRINITY_DN11953_c0_g1_i1.p1 TRINITY_DN11953_c0_g1~~TRINITY_DN11953_c0_g1_i1.p1  ORF type:complete len:329 (+),score=93.81 TRINITY_DN11953_c0_g1_i1:150-1136(+)
MVCEGGDNRQPLSPESGSKRTWTVDRRPLPELPASAILGSLRFVVTSSLDDKVKKAQQEAAIASGDLSAISAAAAMQDKQPNHDYFAPWWQSQEWADKIHFCAMPQAPIMVSTLTSPAQALLLQRQQSGLDGEDEADTAQGGVHLRTAEDLVGQWQDSQGNVVTVQQQSFGQAPLVLAATLSKPPRADIRLNIWLEQTDDVGGACWRCGDAVMQDDGLDFDRIHWLFPDGRVSVWTWNDESADGQPQPAAQDGRQWSRKLRRNEKKSPKPKEKMQRCGDCGKDFIPKALFCWFCGKKREGGASTKPSAQTAATEEVGALADTEVSERS